jgi:hypothetical protein
MCARLTSLLFATAWVVGVGCASKPAEEPSAVASIDQACATASSNSLPLTSSAAPQALEYDHDIDSILTQPTSDPRLAQINRSMYQSLRTLDAELRREERLTACEQQPFSSGTLQAQANSQPGAGGSEGPEFAGRNMSSAAAARPTSIRRTSLSSNGGSGNGATAPKVVPGSDNDIVARRLRKAAEQETNPTLRAKLWKEYTDYRQGTSAK